MMIFFRSLIFSVFFYIGTVFYVLAAIVGGVFSKEAVVATACGWGRYHRWCARWFLGQQIRIVGDLPKGDFLYVSKHESMFETIDFLCLFDRPAIFAKRQLLDIPFWGGIARRYGLIPVDREAGAKTLRAMRAAAQETVAAGRPLCLFPEGTRVPHGQCPPLQAGFAGLYAMLGMPVVPIALNSGLVSPRRSFLKRAGTVTYKIGEIVPAKLDRREAERRVHAAINALND